ncbi:hypothetical protein BXZ70DRAFT_775616 [Cristinia sonorae]|uniref:Uncharacterized protein n=1 Tax=Cristinia sonorae TaxID=1940300 RepID=A0A8K0XJM3_9AGAR|nr:hypothetical protein BXZ70DRAFT_775616 [Cristinia sonorae]
MNPACSGVLPFGHSFSVLYKTDEKMHRPTSLTTTSSSVDRPKLKRNLHSKGYMCSWRAIKRAFTRPVPRRRQLYYPIIDQPNSYEVSYHERPVMAAGYRYEDAQGVIHAHSCRCHHCGEALRFASHVASQNRCQASCCAPPAPTPPPPPPPAPAPTPSPQARVYFMHTPSPFATPIALPYVSSQWFTPPSMVIEFK